MMPDASIKRNSNVDALVINQSNFLFLLMAWMLLSKWQISRHKAYFHEARKDFVVVWIDRERLLMTCHVWKLFLFKPFCKEYHSYNMPNNIVALTMANIYVEPARSTICHHPQQSLYMLYFISGTMRKCILSTWINDNDSHFDSGTHELGFYK